MNFNILMPNEIVFKPNGFLTIPEYVKKFGKKVLIVSNNNLFKSLEISKLMDRFVVEKIECFLFLEVDGEPTPEMVRRASEDARKNEVEFVIGIGGGSVIDVAKAVSGLVPNTGDIEDYLEGIGTEKLKNTPIPLVAVPTTSGTGAEATKNAVISSTEKNYKKSFRDNRLLAKLVFIDSALTLNLPRLVTAQTGMDAITQIIESYTTKNASPFTDSLCRQAAKYFSSLEKVYENGQDLQSREEMSLVSFLSGVTLANSGLGAAHGIAASLGINLGIPHGKACAIMLPSVMRKNKNCSKKGYSELAELALNKKYEDDALGANELVKYIENLSKKLDIGDLKSFNLTDAEIEKIAKGSFGNSMSGNPLTLSVEDIKELIKTVI